MTPSHRYHWALLVGPKNENGPVKGKRYHAINPPPAPGGPRWEYKPDKVPDVRATAQLVARVTVAKIVNEKRLIKIISDPSKVPVDPPNWKGKEDGSEPRWTCRIWEIAALEAIMADGKAVGTNALGDIDGPDGVIEKTKAFVERMKQKKRYAEGTDALAPKPLLDLMTGSETYT